MSEPVYINRVSSFLPNEPVGNDEMEEYLGVVNGTPSRVRPIILRQNQIKTRYYALDKEQNITHTNADLSKIAIDKLGLNHEELEKVKFLSCGTSMPDQLMPSHASMVHGLAFDHPIEIASLAGVCMSGLMALKTAYMSIKSGNTSNAICTASELISPTMLSKFFTEEIYHRELIEEKPYIAFEKDFLRFMLSDGAAALYLSDKIESNRSLKIEWIKTYSYANMQPACMYMWAEKEENGELMGWKTFAANEMAERSIWSLKQDVRQLNEYAVPYFTNAVESSFEETNTSCENITYFIPHISSMYFYNRLDAEFQKRGINLPTSKWFTNLTTVGNMGSASPFIALEEFMRTHNPQKGDKILLFVPESGRFSCGTALLTVM